jgi:ribosomal protein S18 acetylase RimI-like enzyme
VINASIRLAVPDHVEAIRALVRAAYRPYRSRIGRDPAPIGADYDRLVQSSEVWVYVDDANRPVGAIVMRQDGQALFVENVAVAPAQQRRGVGRSLLAFAERHGASLGLVELALYTNAPPRGSVAREPRPRRVPDQAGVGTAVS